MEPIKIQTGQIYIPVEVDGAPTTELVFNPSDVVFAEKFFKVYHELLEMQVDFERQDKQLEENQETDENGIPKNVGVRIALQRQTIEKMYGLVDSLFGNGTSKKIFGELIVPELIAQLFNGVRPYFEGARQQKVEKYLPASRKSKKP